MINLVSGKSIVRTWLASRFEQQRPSRHYNKPYPAFEHQRTTPWYNPIKRERLLWRDVFSPQSKVTSLRLTDYAYVEFDSIDAIIPLPSLSPTPTSTVSNYPSTQYPNVTHITLLSLILTALLKTFILIFSFSSWFDNIRIEHISKSILYDPIVF